jgi:hypothetical protein
MIVWTLYVATQKLRHRCTRTTFAKAAIASAATSVRRKRPAATRSTSGKATCGRDQHSIEQGPLTAARQSAAR